MAENKTRATGASEQQRVAAVESDEQRSDCESLLAKLGKHRMGKACLYLPRLADVAVAVAVLERIVRDPVAETRRRHG
jgi:hypothetical protein